MVAPGAAGGAARPSKEANDEAVMEEGEAGGGRPVSRARSVRSQRRMV